MRQVYTVLDKIKTILRANEITKTVTFGDITEVDLNKTTIFPLAHIIFGNVTFEERILTASVRILCLDIVDVNKEKQTEDMMFGNDNLQDILNTQLQVVNDIQQEMRRGDAFSDNFQINTSVTAEPFQDNFENQLAGWGVTINIEVPTNELSLC
jgi:hypothetical protein|tara:strand:+ start:1584 stop:2045 length:462 start_codon:yes stop_codon:yes gene_type:complete